MTNEYFNVNYIIMKIYIESKKGDIINIFKALILVTFFNCSLLNAQSAAPFFYPSSTSGVIAVKLYPMENVNVGVPTLVTFGVPFTRGSVSPGDVSKIRVLTGSVSTSAEIPAHVKQVTPWRSTTNMAIDSASVRIAKVQITHSFSTTYPNYETIYIEYGQNVRQSNVSNFVNPKSAWHNVTTGSFLIADSVKEPDVYAVFPKQYLSQGALKTRMLPLDDGVPSSRENPSTVDAATYPGYIKVDHAQHNFFYSTINEDDPLVTVPNQCPYKTNFEPWLYDRSTAMYNLYMRSGNIKSLREAVRSSQFYKRNLYTNTTTPSNAVGIFKLKAPNPSAITGPNDAMYSYNECLAYTYWLVSDDEMLNPIKWVVNAHQQNDPPTLWTPTASSWTERFTSFKLLANTIAYEVTGSQAYKTELTNQANDLIWHQNGANGQIPASRIDGGLYHYGSQHGDGTANSLLASSWMTALITEAMVRVYSVSENTAVANFVKRIGTFEKAALKLDANHSYTSSNSGALWYGDYMMRYDGVTDVRDGSEVEHSLDIAVTTAWAGYFAALLGTPDNSIIGAANNAYNSYDVGVNYWIRPTAPASGLTAYRISPWRKYGWEYTPSVSFGWLMTSALVPTNVKEQVNNKDMISIYPNPVKDILTIERKNPGSTKVSVYNVIGIKMVDSEYTEQFIKIDIGNFEPGVYIVKAESNYGTIQRKILKE